VPLTIKKESITTGDEISAFIEIGNRKDGRSLLARVELFGGSDDGYIVRFEDFYTGSASSGRRLTSMAEAMKELEGMADGFIRHYSHS